MISLLVFTSSALLANNSNVKSKNEDLKESIKSISLQQTKTSSSNTDTVIYEIDFTAAAIKVDDIRSWMETEGFLFKSDADSNKKLELTFKNEALNLKAKAGIFAIMPKELDVVGANKIRITWGINKFPKNASYKNGINNEALMVYVYYGKEKLSSGSIFIPGSPYFIGLFLGENEDVGEIRLGRHFKDSGRFICVATPKVGEIVTSEFDLNKGFNDSFGENKNVPAISGIALEIETSKSGESDSFIKKIEFLK